MPTRVHAPSLSRAPNCSTTDARRSVGSARVSSTLPLGLATATNEQSQARRATPEMQPVAAVSQTRPGPPNAAIRVGRPLSAVRDRTWGHAIGKPAAGDTGALGPAIHGRIRASAVRCHYYLVEWQARSCRPPAICVTGNTRRAQVSYGTEYSCLTPFCALLTQGIS